MKPTPLSPSLMISRTLKECIPKAWGPNTSNTAYDWYDTNSILKILGSRCLSRSTPKSASVTCTNVIA